MFDNFLNFWNLRKALKIEGKGNTFKAEGLVKHCHNSQFKIRGKGNEVLCGEGVDLSCFSLKIEGNHNKVIIGKRFRGKRVTLLLKGSGHLIEIGDHVWLGMNVFVGKNSEIADNSVVGWGSVVTRKFKEKGIVIAGNPAVKVKENINWSRRRPTRD